jgi:tight adherence protein B
MTTPAALAFLSAAAAVLAAWEVIGAVEPTRAAARLGRVLAPLARAGTEGREPSASEQQRLALVAAAALAGAGWLIGGLAGAVLAAVAGPSVAVAAVRARRRRYAGELAAGAAGVARALADAIAAGHSIRGAVGEAARGVPGAAGRELRRVAASFALGEPTEAGLERLRRRAASPAWDTMVAGILLQRDAGGDLAGLLRGVAASLEAADRTERDARTATAQARFSAQLVLVLPLAAAALGELAAPGFVTRLAGEPVAAALMATAALLELAAVLAIRRIARSVSR